MTTSYRCGSPIAIGDQITCEVGESEFGELRDGETLTVSEVRETDHGCTQVRLVGKSNWHGGWRFRKGAAVATWKRPDTSDLEPDAAEVAAFEAARERMTKQAKQRTF